MLIVPQKYHTEFKWFALLTRSRAEKKVAERLTENSISVYLPVYTKKSHWSDRIKNVELPLIPSTLFVNCAETTLVDIQKMAGSAVRVLKYLNKPAVVQDFEIENLKIIAQQTQNFEPIAAFNLTEGTLVEVISGPFKGLQATYIEEAGKYKIIVMIKATRTFFEVVVPLNAIKKISVAV
jgi:transcription antitermination factor NusG